MTSFESRPYAGGTDLNLLLDFARNATSARTPGPSPWHVGDVIWQIFGSTGFDPVANIRLWVDGRGIAGIAWFEPPINVVFDVRPGLREHDALTEEILAWAEQRRSEVASPGAGGIPRAYAMLGEESLATTAFDSDLARIAVLTRNGYTKTDRHNVHYSRSLATRIPDSQLPAGMKLSHATDATLEERVDLHRDAWSVWGPSSFNVETYRRLRAAPIYEPELDVVLEGPDGKLLSYCICWEDTANGVGNFEPVGTRPAFTSRGLARATIFEGLRRLRERGMHTALVGTAGVNERALVLYPSCGFELIDRSHYWVKPVS